MNSLCDKSAGTVIVTCWVENLKHNGDDLAQYSEDVDPRFQVPGNSFLSDSLLFLFILHSHQQGRAGTRIPSMTAIGSLYHYIPSLRNPASALQVSVKASVPGLGTEHLMFSLPVKRTVFSYSQAQSCMLNRIPLTEIVTPDESFLKMIPAHGRWTGRNRTGRRHWELKMTPGDTQAPHLVTFTTLLLLALSSFSSNVNCNFLYKQQFFKKWWKLWL